MTEKSRNEKPQDKTKDRMQLPRFTLDDYPQPTRREMLSTLLGRAKAAEMEELPHGH